MRPTLFGIDMIAEVKLRGESKCEIKNPSLVLAWDIFNEPEWGMASCPEASQSPNTKLCLEWVRGELKSSQKGSHTGSRLVQERHNVVDGVVRRCDRWRVGRTLCAGRQVVSESDCRGG